MKCQTISRFLADASVIIGLTTMLVWAFVRAEPARRGFYCNDTSIEYPYRSDTVTFRMVLVIVFPIPLILLLLVEIFNVVNAAKFVDSKKSDDVNGGTEENTTFHISEESKMTSPVTDRKRNAVTGRAVLRLGVIALRNTCRIGLLFWFGLIITLCITEVGKLGVGRLRPHFLDVCSPTGFNCSQGYVTDYQCLGKPRDVLQARKSFPSGHASASAYVALFVVIHMQRRLPVYRAMGLLLRPLLQAALLTGAFYTGLSRVHDHKHHPGDVIVGDVIGILCAVWLMHSVHKHVTYRKCTRTDVVSRSVNNDVV